MAAADLRAWVQLLSRIDRGSCSAGELEAAELISQALRDRGAEVSIERPLVHGTYWWPLGITSAAGLLAALVARRGRGRAAILLGSLAAATAADDLEAGPRWLRRLLPKHRTANVLAWAGDRRAAHTLIVVAHHDAAHSGLFFHPGIGEMLSRRPRWAPLRMTPPVQVPLVAGPALAALSGLPGLRWGAGPAALICLGIVTSMVNIARSPTVPGANDNLSGVVTLLELAERLQARPVTGLRVLLLSTGAEEALLEGMHAFAAKHLALMDPHRTWVLCVDSVGSPILALPEGQGMLRVHPHDAQLRELIARSAAGCAVELLRGTDMRLATDGYVALRRGFPTALLMSVNEHGGSSNYHWHTDTAEHVDYATLSTTIDICEAVVREHARACAGSR